MKKAVRKNSARPVVRRRRANSAAKSRANAFKWFGKRRRRNPSAGVDKLGGLVTSAGWTLAGAVGTRAVTQALLGGKNTGVTGYVANAVAAVSLGYVVKRGTKNEKAGDMVTLGGFVGIVMRLLQDYTPIGAYVKTQLAGMGVYGDATFFVPLQTDPDNRMRTLLPAAVVSRPGPVALPAPVAAAPVSLSGLGRYGQRKGRF